jgi:hypothetical protein
MAQTLSAADEAAIIGLKARYCHAVDATIRDPGQVGELLELLHDDVVVDYGTIGSCRGKEQVRRLYEETLCSMLAWNFHVASNPIPERTGETTATGRWYVYAHGVYRAALAAGPQPVWGRYHERYERTAAGWKIRELQLIVDTPPKAA